MTSHARDALTVPALRAANATDAVDAEVVIVGGGPAGSALATLLARDGVGVLVLDRARFPRPKPCAEYLSPEASRILDLLGSLGAVEETGAAQLAGMVIRAPGGHEIVGRFGLCETRGYRDRGLSVRREVLDDVLLAGARAAGASVREGVRVTDLVRTDSGAVAGVRLADGTAIRARLVVGADGLRSIVAQRLGLTHRARWPRRMALVTHYRGVTGIGECGEMHVERDGFVGIADVGHGETTVALVVPARRAREMRGAREAFLERWLAAHAHLAPRFTGAERISPVIATGPFASRAKRAYADGAVLVGDAADFLDPFTGEGIYSALRGSELLAPFVLDALRAPTRAAALVPLRAYDRARRRTFGGKWLVERLIAMVVANPLLMNRAARALSARRELADLLIGVTGDFVPAGAVLNVRYLYSVFVRPLPRLPGPLAAATLP